MTAARYMCLGTGFMVISTEPLKVMMWNFVPE